MLPFELPAVSAGYAALSPAARDLGRRAADRAAGALAAHLSGPVEIAARALPAVFEASPGFFRLGLSLGAVPAAAALEVEATLAARLADRLAGGPGEAPESLEPTRLERAAVDLLALAAISAATEEAGVAALAPRLAVPAEVRGALAVELQVAAGRLRGAAWLLLPPEALRAVAAGAAPSPLPPALAAWTIEAPLLSGRAALERADIAALEPGDVVLLDEPPSPRAEVRLSGLVLRGFHEDGHLQLEELAVTETAAALPVVLAVEVARLSLTLGELSRLEPGAALPLHAPRDGRVLLRLGERAVARGQLVEIEGALGVRVETLE